MPNVGGRKFPYTPEGVAAAKAYSRTSGLPLTMEQGKVMQGPMTGAIGQGPPAAAPPGRRPVPPQFQKGKGKSPGKTGKK